MKTSTKQTLRIFWQHARKYPWAFFGVVFSISCAIAAESAVPYLYKRLFNLLASPGASLESLSGVVISILLIGVVSWSFWRIATFVNDFFQPRVMADILNTCFRYLHDHSFSFFSNNFAGSLVKKVGRFERAFEDIADHIYWNMMPAALRMVIILSVLSTVNGTLTLYLLVWCAVFLAFSFGYARFKLKYDIANAEMDTRVGGRLADTVTNNINLKLFGGLLPEYESFKALTQKQFKLRKWVWDLSSINEAIQGGLMVVLEFGMLYLAVQLYQEGKLTLGDFALIQGYLTQLFGRLWDLGRHIKNLYSRLGDAEEMVAILAAPHGIQDARRAKELSVTEAGIEFRDVDFGYEGPKMVFKNFDLSIKPGEKVGIIGPSGGGKTTIVKMLFRFFDLNGGKILIDGQDIAKVTQESLRANLALVPQEPILFHRSLYDNIAYARPSASEKEVYEAARLAHAHEFITGFPEGYKTFVGERGVKLSGGERQRVAIARAILKNAPILVLDEATSSLDSESEMFIQDALKNLMKGKTTIVIAHRLSAIMQMDRIIVIKKGKIVEEGKHKELLKARQGVYQKLWEIQAGGFAK